MWGGTQENFKDRGKVHPTDRKSPSEGKCKSKMEEKQVQHKEKAGHVCWKLLKIQRKNYTDRRTE